jgi:hypothetical protein
MLSGVIIKPVWKFGQLLRGLYNTRINGLREPKKTDRVDSLIAVDRWVELARDIVMVSRCHKVLVLGNNRRIINTPSHKHRTMGTDLAEITLQLIPTPSRVSRNLRVSIIILLGSTSVHHTV